ncbi:N-isopropylammelide isopropyl amidohydrolase [Hartmannibacter diazotrophicus]|uniref:N-isopropylammelide isopropyl amidohydrolase n=1 Tax=Hartmannibacter diazotrophicus TaxID=1482074 RepID=A0A2C9DCS4_9HYPH|nr:amidohydrolase family protein [Hartmannibacter diazotrophicus]SON58033.1 N-isopropylammelide isopropyl amidohydrolase [Hartmannibacter diazotrophicus]
MLKTPDDRTTLLRLANVCLADREGLFDVVLGAGVIGSIEPASTVNEATEALDLEGRLLLPAFVDGHIHLDKTFLGLPWRPHVEGHTVAARIAAERKERATAAREMPMKVRACKLIDRIAGYGTLALRSHIDIDEEIGLSHVHDLLALREEVAGLVDIQFVAFPQSGLTAKVREMMDEALSLGVDLVGGLDPAGIDNDLEGHLDTVFELAEKHGRGVDIHLHDPGLLGTFELKQIARRSAALGMQGHVAVSHAYALGMVDAGELAATASELQRGGVSIMTNGPGNAAIPPIKALIEAGVRVFSGCDNIRDAWSPFGTGDLLERAAVIGYRAGFASDADLALAFDLVTTHSRAVMGLAPVTLEPGSPADLVAVKAENLSEAVASTPRERMVFRKGRPLA